MPLTKQEYEQIEIALNMFDDREDSDVAKVLKLLSKYVAEPAPEAPPQKTAADFMGANYKGEGCHVCIGMPQPNPCRICGWDREAKVFVSKSRPSKTPQPGETGRKEFLEESLATKLIEVVDAEGDSTWLNVPEEALDPSRGNPVLMGKVYDYKDGKLVENTAETGKMQVALKVGDKSRIILPGE